MSTRPAQLVLVHGTFAEADEDRGDKWWQRGSPFWNWLEENLPYEISLPGEDEPLFHWSGGNRWSARLLGGATLLTFLRSLDKRGFDYHLIAHSHGGTVLWEALRFSMEAQEGPLRGLRTWTTVGTPFPAARTSLWAQMRWLLLGIAGVLLLVILTILVTMRAAPPEATELPLLLTPLHYLPLMLALPAIQENRSARREAETSARAASEYMTRWRCVFSRHDEAIAGLRASTTLRVTLPRKHRLDDVIYDMRRHLRPLRLAHRVQASVYNAIGRRAAEAVVTRQLAGAAIGDDRPGVSGWNVGTAPEGAAVRPPLPEDLDQQLLGIADEQASATLRTVRRRLRAEGGGLTHASFPLGEAGLVHNAYFASAMCRELLLAGLSPTQGGRV